MRNRPIGWWRDWLNKDPVYSAQPYAQLAGVLAASGNRDGAADIRFFGRDRERSELLRGCTWLQKLGLAERPDDDRPCRWGPGLRPERTAAVRRLRHRHVRLSGGVLGAGAGAHRHDHPVLRAGVRGVRPVRLLTRPRRGPRQKSLLWCFGASLQHVLPLVTISQEFSEFFNDPKRERLYAMAACRVRRARAVRLGAWSVRRRGVLGADPELTRPAGGLMVARTLPPLSSRGSSS